MTLYEHISSNKRKSVLLVFLFFVIIGLLGYIIGIYFGNGYAGLAMGFAISIIMTLVSYFSGDRMILSMSGAVVADGKKYPHLINTVEGLAIAAGMPPPKVYVIDDSAINAFATGRNPENASITVTTGAISRLKRDELEGVVAHEMAHIRNYDIRMMMLVVILVGVIALLSDLLLRSFIYGRRRNDREGGIFVVIIMLAGLVLAVLAPVISQLIRLAVSRKREYLADSDGALLCRNPQGLANALKKIRDDKEPLVEAANKSTAHLFIENPLRTFKGRLNKVNGLFSTHPPIEERIRILEGSGH